MFFNKQFLIYFISNKPSNQISFLLYRNLFFISSKTFGSLLYDSKIAINESKFSLSFYSIVSIFASFSLINVIAISLVQFLVKYIPCAALSTLNTNFQSIIYLVLKNVNNLVQKEQQYSLILFNFLLQSTFSIAIFSINLRQNTR